MRVFRLFVAPLWLVTLASFVFVNLGNTLLFEAMATQGLATIFLASALPLDPNTPRRRQWFAFAVGEHSGLMAISLILLTLGGGTTIEKQLALALSIGSLAILGLALPRLNRRRRATERVFDAGRPNRSDRRKTARRWSDPYFHEGRRTRV